MKSVVNRILLSANSATRSRRKSSSTKAVWKQTPDGKWHKLDTSSQATTPVQVCDNPNYLLADIEAPHAFLCDSCDVALHFRQLNDFETRCSICNQVCGTIQLTCNKCGLCICCNAKVNHVVPEEEWKSSCYDSYFDSDESVRKLLFNRQDLVSGFSTEDQQRWLQSMWHDIVQNANRFRAELQHASKVDSIDFANGSLIVENLGLNISKGLVRLFITFQNEFSEQLREWFSSLIQHEPESLGSVAIETSVRLNDRLEQVKWLVHELKLNALNCQLSDALGFVAKTGNVAVLDFLIKDAGADPSANDNYAMRFASRNGHLSVLDRLLQDDRVNPSADKNFAIQHACYNGHLEIVERLLQDERVDPSAYNNKAIIAASNTGRLDIVERLLQDERVNPTSLCNMAIQVASRNGHLKVVERLLHDDRVDPTANGGYALRAASQMGHLHVVERLLQDDRVDPSAADNKAIQSASRNGHLKVVERLLQDDRADPAANGSFALRAAIFMGHLKVMERLLQDDRIRPEETNVVLRWACENGYWNAVEQLLVDVRVDPSLHDNSAIQVASRNGYSKVVEQLLLDVRVDPSANDNEAIQAASRSGHLEVVERLLQDVRVDPSANDNEAILVASRKSHVRVVERLLADGRVDPTAQDCAAMKVASDNKVVECLFNRTRHVVCFMINERDLMKKLTPLHRESLIMGGLCLSHGGEKLRAVTLPQGIIVVILSEWTALIF